MILKAFSLNWLNLNYGVNESWGETYLSLKLLVLVLSKEVDKVRSMIWLKKPFHSIGSVSMIELMIFEVKYILGLTLLALVLNNGADKLQSETYLTWLYFSYLETFNIFFLIQS